MRRISILLFTLCLCLVCTSVITAGNTPRLVDTADILSETEEQTLLSRLDALSEEQMVDVVIHTLPSLSGNSIEYSTDNIFESCGYGMDADRSCILLVVSMEEGEWHITTAGYGITAVTDTGLAYLSEKFVPHLSAGEYAAAFGAYADGCEDFLQRARTGNPFDEDDLPKEPFPALRNFLICLAIGLIGAWILVGKEKSKLTSVRQKFAAKDYVRSGSLAVTDAKDLFLYKTVSRREKADSSEKSDTHKTSSGNTVGGGGGKF